MKRLPLIGALLFGLAACVSEESATRPQQDPPTFGGVDDTDTTIACYDTGHGVKCVFKREMPADASVVCTDHDGFAKASESSASGPSPSDDDTSDSSDGPHRDHGNCNDSSDSADDDSGNSDSDTKDVGCDDPNGDADGDGVPNGQDCDCACPDNPPPADQDPPPPPPPPPPPVAFCGNGVVEGVEECDDGNTNPFDGCDACINVDINPGKRNLGGYSPTTSTLSH
jgi:cysteine-rich repeat protein